MTPHIPNAELDDIQEDARARTAWFMFRLNVTMVLFMSVLFLAGCGTYNSWTPREPEAAPERSCASGYYKCRMNDRESTNDHEALGGPK
jgi:hypothetical protein